MSLFGGIEMNFVVRGLQALAVGALFLGGAASAAEESKPAPKVILTVSGNIEKSDVTFDRPALEALAWSRSRPARPGTRGR